MSFIEQHGLWTDAQARRAREVLARIDQDGIETVRFVFADQHGIPHGKALVGGAAVAAMREGVRLVGTILLKDTSGRTAWPVFGGSAPFGGRDFHSASDVVLVPDPATFCLLPWVEKTAWMQCNAFFPDGRPVPYDTRAVCTRALDRLAQSGFEYVAGLEVEFYVFRVDNPRLASADAGWPAPPPEVSLLHSKASLLHGGFQVLAEQQQAATFGHDRQASAGGRGQLAQAAPTGGQGFGMEFRVPPRQQHRPAVRGQGIVGQGAPGLGLQALGLQQLCGFRVTEMEGSIGGDRHRQGPCWPLGGHLGLGSQWGLGRQG